MTFPIRYRVLFAAIAAALSLSACVNLFDPIDNPSGDQQNLSAARAAFDKGDLDKARELYEKLGSSEIATSEKIFLDLDSCGADIAAFGSALGGTSNGASAGLIPTIISEKMNARHGTACLETLRRAYQTSQTITDTNLKGFAGFLAAMAVAGEVLAHNTGITTDGELAKADVIGIVTSSATCTASGASCGAGCAVVDGISAVASTGNLAGYGTITPTWGVFQDAITAADAALTLLGVSTGSSQQLIAAFRTGGAAASSSNFAYRCILHDIGVGR